MMRSGLCVACLLSCAGAALAGPPRLLGIDTSGSVLYEIDPATGATTRLVSVVGGATIGSLAYDPTTDTLFAASTSLHQLFKIDYTTGAATLIGSFGLAPNPFMHGMEWDTSTNTLYGYAYAQASLYAIDPATGAATLLGPSGFAGSSSFGSLGYDSTNDVMYYSHTGLDTLYKIERSSGAVSALGPHMLPGQIGIGMAYHPDYGMLAVDNQGSPTDTLLRLDLNTGAAQIIGNMGSSNIISLVFIGDPVAQCYADCDSSTGVGVLDIFDFLCFQNRFAASAAYACECDTSTGPGVCDIFDFLCFQNAFAAGCP